MHGSVAARGLEYWEARERGECLRKEASSLDALLATYGAHTPVRESLHALSALEHHDLLNDPTACGCGTCGEWADRRSDFVSALRLLPDGHRWHTCMCSPCRFIASAHTFFLAASNKRDLLIQMAYYARQHSRHPSHVMAWFEQEIKNPAYTPAWCAQYISTLPTKHWLRRCESMLRPIVSGVVFYDVDLTVGFNETTISVDTLIDIMCDRSRQ